MGICSTKDKKVILISETLLLVDLSDDSKNLLYKMKENDVEYKYSELLVRCCSELATNSDILKKIIKLGKEIDDKKFINFILENFDILEILEEIYINIYDNLYADTEYMYMLNQIMKNNFILNNTINIFNRIIKNRLRLTKKSYKYINTQYQYTCGNKYYFYNLLIKIIKNEKNSIDDNLSIKIFNIFKTHFSDCLNIRLVEKLVCYNVNINLCNDNFISDDNIDIMFIKKLKK